MTEEGLAKVSQEDWDKKLAQAKVSKEELNAIVMNFLVTEGYMDAARTFQEESGTPLGPVLDVSDERMHIRNAVEQGRIEEAIERVNNLNPEILESNATLLFHLQQQHLIELIRAGKIEEALAFAQEYLSYKGEENAGFLDDLESTVALVAFADPLKSPVQHLMDMSHRKKTASELNGAILTQYHQDREPRLAALMKMLVWGQQRLSKHMSFPMLDLSDQGAPQVPGPQDSAQPTGQSAPAQQAAMQEGL